MSQRFNFNKGDAVTVRGRAGKVLESRDQDHPMQPLVAVEFNDGQGADKSLWVIQSDVVAATPPATPPTP